MTGPGRGRKWPNQGFFEQCPPVCCHLDGRSVELRSCLLDIFVEIGLVAVTFAELFQNKNPYFSVYYNPIPTDGTAIAVTLFRERRLGKVKIFGRSFRWILVIPIVGGLGILFVWLAYGKDPGANAFTTAIVQKETIEETVSAVGVVQPLEYVDVGTQVTGQLKALHVAIGDRVKEKDLLAEIDPTLFAAAVGKTKATLQNLQAQLADKLASKRLAEQQNARNKQLLEANAASAEVVEQSVAAEEQAKAQVEALRAQIKQAESQLSADEANLRYTKIYAPMSGTVVSLPARQGQTLVASQQAPVILRIADLSTMTVWAQTSEADVPKIRVGMDAYFNTLGEPNRRWSGRVRQVLPTPDTVNNVILYNVLFDVANPDLALKTQMSAQVYFVLAKAQDALVVPSGAIKSARGAEGPGKTGRANVANPACKVSVLQDGEPLDKPVTVGISNRLVTQVLSGLSEGETVIVKSAKRTERSGARPLPGATQGRGH
jgi:macrolide-specific efflux system membrane fusion protein